MEKTHSDLLVQTPTGEYKGCVKTLLPTREIHTPLEQLPIESAKASPPKAESILEEAQRIVHGQRNQDYGSPLANFTQTAGLINATFGTEFIAEDIPILMILLKISRHRHKRKRDNLVDIAGYAATAEMVERERSQ